MTLESEGSGVPDPACSGIVVEIDDELRCILKILLRTRTVPRTPGGICEVCQLILISFDTLSWTWLYVLVNYVALIEPAS